MSNKKTIYPNASQESLKIIEVNECIHANKGKLTTSRFKAVFNEIYRLHDLIAKLEADRDQLKQELQKATYREKNWQEVAGQLAVAGNGIYYHLNEKGLSQNDLDEITKHREFILRYLNFSENL